MSSSNVSSLDWGTFHEKCDKGLRNYPPLIREMDGNLTFSKPFQRLDDDKIFNFSKPSHFKEKITVSKDEELDDTSDSNSLYDEDIDTIFDYPTHQFYNLINDLKKVRLSSGKITSGPRNYVENSDRTFVEKSVKMMAREPFYMSLDTSPRDGDPDTNENVKHKLVHRRLNEIDTNDLLFHDEFKWEKENDELLSNIKNKRKTIKKLKRKIKNAKQEILVEKQNVEDNRKENTSLRRLLKKETRTAKRFNKMYKQEVVRNEDLQNHLTVFKTFCETERKCFKSECDAAYAKIEELQDHIARVEKEKSELTERIKTSKDEISALKKREIGLEVDMSFQERKCNDMNAELLALRRSFENLLQTKAAIFEDFIRTKHELKTERLLVQKCTDKLQRTENDLRREMKRGNKYVEQNNALSERIEVIERNLVREIQSGFNLRQKMRKNTNLFAPCQKITS